MTKWMVQHVSRYRGDSQKKKVWKDTHTILRVITSGEGEENSVLGNVLIFYQERIYMYNLYHYIFFK